MIILYRIYQLFIMAPVLLVATVLTALTVMAASVLGFGRSLNPLHVMPLVVS